MYATQFRLCCIDHGSCYLNGLVWHLHTHKSRCVAEIGVSCHTNQLVWHHLVPTLLRASKYAHFFVDPGRFYILDYNAGQALAVHLGARRVDPADWPDYPAFVQRVETLRRRDRITVSNRELDHYLWLYGCWRDYLANRLVSPELGETFKRADAELRLAFGE